MTDAETITDLREKLLAADRSYSDLLTRVGKASEAAALAAFQAKTAADAAEKAQKEIAGILGGILEGRPAIDRCPRCRRPMEAGHVMCDLCELKENLLNRQGSPWNPGPSEWRPVPEITPQAPGDLEPWRWGLPPITTIGSDGTFPKDAGNTTRQP